MTKSKKKTGKFAKDNTQWANESRNSKEDQQSKYDNSLYPTRNQDIRCF